MPNNKTTTRIIATVPLIDPPTWAILERHLFAALDASIDPFLTRFARPDGTLIWSDTLHGRDGADDFYESSYNWPLLYLLGGSDRLKELSVRQWEAITHQVSALRPIGQLFEEYERGYDWFHQGESNLYFYFLCLADPTRTAHQTRATRFAGLYLNEDPRALNYDAELRIIRAAHNGSRGPRWGFTDDPEPRYGWGPAMRRYGLPFADVEGVTHYDDLEVPNLARRMGDAMQDRMGRGDVVGNLGAVGLIANAYAMTGDPRYVQWVTDYVDAWADRTRRNQGQIPDNVGLSGQVGEYLGGRWYGGLYGWTWPHGFYSIAMAALVASSAAVLVTRDLSYLELARTVIDRAMELGRVDDYDETQMTLPEHWVGQRQGLAKAGATRSFVIPHRHGDGGWFDYQPMAPMYPVALWATSLQTNDRARIDRLRTLEAYDWRTVVPFRSKEDAGHEAPWMRFLDGENPDYPTAILRQALATVHWRLSMIRNDRIDLPAANIHHWQQHNPVTTEALVQLTLGAPSPIYNGGLLHAPIRHFDGHARRPGLPPDVCALVSQVDSEAVVLELVNLSQTTTRECVIQAGAFAEHDFASVEFTRCDNTTYPGGPSSAPPTPSVTRQTVAVQAAHLGVVLPPGTTIELRMTLQRYVHRPTTHGPTW